MCIGTEVMSSLRSRRAEHCAQQCFRKSISFVLCFSPLALVVVFQEGSDIITFETLSPSWNEALHAWTLNFNGRVKIPSKKNFLVAPEKVGGSFPFFLVLRCSILTYRVLCRPVPSLSVQFFLIRRFPVG